MANTFLAPPPRGVAALVSVSDDKIKITILILRRGALSIFKGRGESGLMFGAAFDRQNWPDVRPVFGKPSLKENYSDLPKTGIKAIVDIYGEFK